MNQAEGRRLRQRMTISRPTCDVTSDAALPLYSSDGTYPPLSTIDLDHADYSAQSQFLNYSSNKHVSQIADWGAWLFC